MKNKSTKNELAIAKKSAIEAGSLLLRNKKTMNQEILSTNKDIKLKADVLAEKEIKTIIEN